MGFSGGGSNILKAHKHDGTVVQDGGELAANVTQFGLTAGSILYSDGSNIQELAISSPSDVLTVNGAASAPAWVTPAAAGADFVLLDSGGPNLTSIDTGSLTSFDNYEIIKCNMFMDVDAVEKAAIRIYNESGNIETSSDYQVCGFSSNTNFTRQDDRFEITNGDTCPSEGLAIFLTFYNARTGGYGCGMTGAFKCDDNGGCFSGIFSSMNAGDTTSIRGIQLINPGTFDHGSYVVYGCTS